MKYLQNVVGGILGLSMVAKAHPAQPDHLQWGEWSNYYSISTSRSAAASTATSTWTAKPQPQTTANSKPTTTSEDDYDCGSPNYPPTSLPAQSSTRTWSTTSTTSSTSVAAPSSLSTSPVSTTVTWKPVPSSAKVSSMTTSTYSPTSAVASSSSSKQYPTTSSSPSSPTTPLVGGWNSGQATFYGTSDDIGGTCLFTDYNLPAGMYGTALSVDNWDSAAWCGACVSVVGPSGNSIKAMIVNQCPGDCGLNHLDLLPNGFAQLADPTLGRIDVTWEIIECGITSPISLHNKDGTSKWWFSMQVVNSNVPVQSLEVSTDGGKTWQSTTRRDYNFFENSSGFGVDVVDVRVTSVTGETIIINNVGTASATTIAGTSNFS